MPRLRCLAGPSPSELVPITVNSSEAHKIESDIFQGKVSVYIDFEPAKRSSLASRTLKRISRSPSPQSDKSSRSSKRSGSGSGSNAVDEAHEYFSRPERKGVTWSIQVQGRFLKKYSANDVLFGNTFDRPLHLPWGSSAVLKFMHHIDPSLEHDLAGQHPWALSPLISTMPYFNHQKRSQGRSRCSSPTFSQEHSLQDDVRHLNSSQEVPTKAYQSPYDRRAYFADPEAREAVTFGPDDIITTDFCYGFLSFPSLSLSLPAGLSFDLTKYWDGQPVRFVCCERNPGGFMQARTFWCVVFEIINDDEDEDGSDSASGSTPDSVNGVDLRDDVD